ncbi:hypothetical protein D3C76_1034170 [compost metagenome]
MARSKEELQRTRHLLHQGLTKRLQHNADIIVRQTALLLRQAGLLDGQAVSALNVLGELAATKQLLAGVDDPPVMQHAQGGHGCSNIDHRHQSPLQAPSLALQQAERSLQGIGLDVDHARSQARQGQGCLTDFDVFLATGGQQHVDPLRIAH